MDKKFKNLKCDRFLDRLIKNKADFSIKKGVEIDQIIFGDTHFLYATPNKNFPKKKLFLFKVVNDDVKKFIDQNPFIDLPPQQPTQYFNVDYDETIGVITGTDLDHAYWRIAYVKGYISKKVYLRGIEDDDAKTIRLATLGNLGREDKFERYINGEYIETYIHRAENKAMKKVYKDIRYTCYYMMFQLSAMLGDDFESWATDCIYYRDSAENRKKVHDFFDMHNMLYKQLTYNSMDFFEGVESEEPTEEPTIENE
jgi:hypothetical protein